MECKTVNSKENAEDYKNKEWPGVQEDKNCDIAIKPELLIMELWRLVPYLEGEYVRFSPINMPTIKIGCIHVIGVILNIYYSLKQYKFTVDDGTGILNVKCNLKHFGTTHTGNQDKAEISKDDPEDKDLMIGDYVHLQGFLSLSEYNKAYKNSKDKNFVERFIYGQPVFYAVNVELITEEQYHKKMYLWFKTAKKRYNEMRNC